MLALLLLTALSLALPAAPAHAGITELDAFGNVVYNQTSAAAPTTPLGFFFGSRIDYSNTGDITSATGLSGSSANPLTYAFEPGTAFTFIAQTPFLTQTQLNDYNSPGSVLSVNTDGGLGVQNGFASYGPTLYPSAVPTLTAASYNLLQGLDASTMATIDFNNFIAPAGATSSFTFIDITNASTGEVVFGQSFLNSSTTSFDLPVNTLAANTSYNLEIDFSNRAASLADGSPAFAGVTFTAGYDIRTEIAFTTAAAVPEPASLALTAIGVASAVLVARRRRMR